MRLNSVVCNASTRDFLSFPLTDAPAAADAADASFLLLFRWQCTAEVVVVVVEEEEEVVTSTMVEVAAATGGASDGGGGGGSGRRQLWHGVIGEI